MTRHNEINKTLYDYSIGGLDPKERTLIEQHLSSCPKCSADLKEIQHSLALMRGYASKPSEVRSPEYWQNFSLRVEERIQIAARNNRIARPSMWEQFQSYFLFHRGAVYATGMACLLLVSGLFFWKGIVPSQREEIARNSETIEPPVTNITPVSTANERLGSYFRKSKTLLVGLSNMKTDATHTIDLSFERQASRSLIREARYLQGQQIDMRSARLIEDLNRILIELANLEEQNDLPNVEMIRGGIHQENLLFKIRMAEALYDSASRNNDNTF